MTVIIYFGVFAFLMLVYGILKMRPRTDCKDNINEILEMESEESDSIDNDETLIYEKNTCWKCEYFDGYDMCCHRCNFGAIGSDSVKICKVLRLFKKDSKTNDNKS